jgi:DNA-binding MarR family transcriptional regulator
VWNNAVMKKRDESGKKEAGPRGWAAPAFLLAQVGAHAAAKFSERLRPLGLSPAHAGILRILEAAPAITQQALASALGSPPSRLVALVDELESKALVERRPNESDRRRYALSLTAKGKSMLHTIGTVVREHQNSLLAALSEEERLQLTALLLRIAMHQGLKKGVHPGYSAAGRAEEILDRNSPTGRDRP